MSIPTLYLIAIVDGTFTNTEGNKLYTALVPYLATGQTIRLSLRDATPMSTSFLNSSFGELIDKFGLSAFRNTLRIGDYIPSHAAAIKRYVDNYQPAAELATS